MQGLADPEIVCRISMLISSDFFVRKKDYT